MTVKLAKKIDRNEGIKSLAKTTLHAIGRRKTSVAKIFIKKGAGEFTVNKKTLEEYFAISYYKNVVLSPFAVVSPIDESYSADSLSISVTISGGGTSSQAQAIRHAIAVALSKINVNFSKALKTLHLVTTDRRQVERKIPGHFKSRKKDQFSKR